jgi:hypothetical protein
MCERTLPSQKSLNSTSKRGAGSMKKYKDELKETKRRLKKLEEV